MTSLMCRQGHPNEDNENLPNSDALAQRLDFYNQHIVHLLDDVAMHLDMQYERPYYNPEARYNRLVDTITRTHTDYLNALDVEGVVDEEIINYEADHAPQYPTFQQALHGHMLPPLVLHQHQQGGVGAGARAGG